MKIEKLIKKISSTLEKKLELDSRSKWINVEIAFNCDASWIVYTKISSELSGCTDLFVSHLERYEDYVEGEDLKSALLTLLKRVNDFEPRVLECENCGEKLYT